MKEKEVNNGKGIASFVCSIVSWFTCWIPFVGLILSILAIVFATKQLKENKSGLAIAGLVIGIITCIGCSFYNLFYLFIVFAASMA